MFCSYFKNKARHYLVLRFVLLLGLFAFTPLLFLNAQSMNANDVRRLYTAAIESAAKTEQLHQTLTALKPTEPLVLAYLGAVEALLAKHAWNPYNKVAWLNKAAKNFSSALKKSPNHAEIRYLRFSTEHYLPPFLGHNHLQEDLENICKHLDSAENVALGKDVSKAIAKFLLASNRCNGTQKAILKPYLD